MTLSIKETWVDATNNVGCGDSDWYDTNEESRGELFRSLIRNGEYGRCVSKVYVDYPVFDGIDGETHAVPVGWVFQRRRKYDDVNETYLAETWVEVKEQI